MFVPIHMYIYIRTGCHFSEKNILFKFCVDQKYSISELNASKAASFLIKGDNEIFRSLETNYVV